MVICFSSAVKCTIRMSYPPPNNAPGMYQQPGGYYAGSSQPPQGGQPGLGYPVPGYQQVCYFCNKQCTIPVIENAMFSSYRGKLSKVRNLKKEFGDLGAIKSCKSYTM